MPTVIIGGLLVIYLAWTTFFMQAAGDPPAPTVVALASPPAQATSPLVVLSATAPPATLAVTPTASPTARGAPSPTPAPATSTPGRIATPTGIRPGSPALVDTGSNDGLRLRRDPGSAGVVLRSIRNGERVSVLDGPREADGVTWWRVVYGGDEGWVAGQYLRPSA